jgi:DNA-directed RNA polymerase specialized sigma24 family protein
MSSENPKSARKLLELTKTSKDEAALDAVLATLIEGLNGGRHDLVALWQLLVANQDVQCSWLAAPPVIEGSPLAGLAHLIHRAPIADGRLSRPSDERLAAKLSGDYAYRVAKSFGIRHEDAEEISCSVAKKFIDEFPQLRTGSYHQIGWKKLRVDRALLAAHAWIGTVARNEARDLVRWSTARKRDPGRPTLPIDGSVNPTQRGRIPDGTTPEHKLEVKSAVVAFYKAYEGTPIEEREVITHLFVYGQTEAWTAEHTGKPVGTVKAIKRRFIDRLKLAYFDSTGSGH